ncbi:MAG: DUF2442 domain-containing protein [Bacteroidia bacterium]|nr:DUF2442 domain-containing protein [Bacteroidia bacterium]
MITTEIKPTAIRNVEFINNNIMFVHLDNDRTFIVPLSKFHDIANLTNEQRNDFEIIDGNYLSFLAIDNIYSINDLIGLK